MNDGQDLCFSLVKWLQTFKLKNPHSTVEEISDGTAMAESLTQIAPEWFNAAFISKIKTDVGANWRLKVSNLKKIMDYILDYYSDNLNQQLSNFTKPDVVKIGEHCDRIELGRLLQLLLGCAVNCSQKQAYITIIMGMEESVQRVIMQAIQELENGSQASLNLTEDFQIQRLMSDIDRITEERDKMAQKCYELNNQVTLLQDEKTGLQDEVRKLRKSHELESPASGSVSSSKYSLLRRELDTMKEELFKTECARDDARARMESQDRVIIELQTRVDDLQASADEARILKDEMDVLRETADKAGKYEATIESYKRKLEELGDLKRHCKILEDKNAGYLQMNIDLEDELKRQGAWKSQAEAYKKQLSEFVLKQKEEAIQVDKLMYENGKMQEKIDALLREKERLMVERNLLKESNDELTCQMSAATASNIAGTPNTIDDLNIDLRERLARLTSENRQLKMEQQEAGQLSAVQALLDTANEQIELLQQDARKANKRLLEVEGELNELQSNKLTDVHQSPSIGTEQLTHKINQMQEQLDETQRNNVQLKEALTRKEAEVAAAEEKYKKNMEKAKAVVSSLEPKQQSEALRHQIEKSLMQRLEQDRDQPLLNEIKIMNAAFHHLASQRQRESVDQRLATLSTGQSFLARQRAPVARKVTNK